MRERERGKSDFAILRASSLATFPLRLVKPQNNFVKLPIGRKVYFNPIAIPSVYSDLCYTILNKFFTVVIMYGRITMPKSPNQKLKLMFVFRGVFIGHLS